MNELPLATTLEVGKIGNDGGGVVILGLGSRAKIAHDIFRLYNVEVFGFYTDGRRRKRNIYQGKSLLSKRELQHLSDKGVAVILQEVDYDQTKIEIMKQEFSSLNISFSYLSVGQILFAFYPQLLCNKLRNNDEYEIISRHWGVECIHAPKLHRSNLFLSKMRAPILLCLPPKTADHTLINTFNNVNKKKIRYDTNNQFYEMLSAMGRVVRGEFPSRVYRRLIRPLDKIGKNINFRVLWHKPMLLSGLNNITKKIITGVREPIAQNLSIMFQGFSGTLVLEDWVLGDLEGVVDKGTMLDLLQKLFMDYGSDVQKWFDAYIDRYVYPCDGWKPSTHPRSIQEFIYQFNEHVINLYSYPFDQEAGYTIIKEGNTEIFVYQLEKLNSIVPQLSEWVGVPFDKLEKGNVGEDKWIGESYKQAQKEIQITQEYFDRCFNEPYVKHFYSEADIEKFKARWRPHIKHED